MKITSLLAVGILVAALCTGVSAAKLTIDPYKNGGSTASLEKPGPDLRLALKISYTSTDKRLHTVVEDIAKQTGVNITTGKNTEDWPVRDIPMVVCVKNLPLGKLLRAIADATHLALSAYTVKGVKQYRIWRDPARQKQLAEYYESMDENKRTVLNDQWDAWATLKQKGFSAMSYGDSEVEKSKAVLLQSAVDVMAALPAGSKEAVMSGKLLTFDMKSSSPRLAQALKAYFQNLGIYTKDSYEADASNASDDIEVSAEDGSSNRPEPPRDLTDADLEKLKFSVGSQRSYFESTMMVPGLFDLESLSGLCVGLDFDSFIGDYTYPGFTGDEALNKLEGEDSEDTPEPPETSVSPSMTKLNAERSDINGLDSKFKIPKPKEETEPTFATLVVNIAEASGFSIVCEDFHSHSSQSVTEQFSVYDKETTLKALFTAPPEEDSADSLGEEAAADAPEIDPEANVEASVDDGPQTDYWASDTHWLADPASKLVVGLHSAWWNKNKSLVPEKIITGLINKINNDGLEIEDAAPLLLLRDDQYSDWILNHRDLGSPFYFRMAVSNLDFWKIYAGLSSENKALAKSKDGLPLASLPKASVLAAFGKSAERSASMGDLGKLVAAMNWKNSRPEMDSRYQAWSTEHIAPDSEGSRDSMGIAEKVKSMLEAFPEMKPVLDPPPTDPAKILSLKMRLVKVDLTGSRAVLTGNVPVGEGEKKPHTYRLVFEGDGVKVDAGSFGNTYPIYSEKRIAELIAEQKKKSEKKQPSENSPK